MNRALLAVAVSTMLAVAAKSALAKSHPSATVKISGKSVAAGVGISWGKGTLTYQGKQYPFSIDGLSVLDVGVSSIDATGTVYNLKRLEDFGGQYVAASAGGAVAGGAGVSSMKNANGVVMNLHAVTRGVKLKAGADGIKVTLEK